MISQIKKGLKELNFSDNEIKIYVALTELGEAEASKVAKKTELPRTTVISILNKLSEKGYFSTHIYKGTTYFWIESPKTLENIFTNQAAVAAKLNTLLTDLYRSDTCLPFAQVYDTKKAIKNFIEKLLINLRPKSILYTFDSPHLGDYEKIFSRQFRDVMLDMKKEKGILTKTLVPKDTFGLIDKKKLSPLHTIKELPEGIPFSASIWFSEKQLVLFSGKPPFLVLIHHEPIFKSLKCLFDFYWTIATPVGKIKEL